MEEFKLQESIKEKMSTPYEWLLQKPEDVKIVVLVIDDKSVNIK